MADKRKRPLQEYLGLDQYGGQIHDQHVPATAKSKATGEPRLGFTVRFNKPDTAKAQVAYEHAGWPMAEPKKFMNVARQSSGHPIHSQYASKEAFTRNRDDDYYEDDCDNDNDHTDDELNYEDSDDELNYEDIDDGYDDESDREIMDESFTSQGGQGERVKGSFDRNPGGLVDWAEGRGESNPWGQKPSNMVNVDGDRVQGRGGKGWGQSTSRTPTRLFPGGPLDHTLLTSFGGHVALAIWGGVERPVLNCITHHEQLIKWKVPKGQQADLHVARAGLSHLSQFMSKHVNMPLLSAFVERWHPETNSFHMPFGEMTITLHDVFYILNIPIVGRAVVHEQGRKAMMQSIADHLRMDFVDVTELWVSGGLTIDTIQQQCLQHGMPPMDVARGYLTYLLENTLFVDKTNDNYPARLLSLLHDIDAASEYSWAAATLAHLYRQLGLASRADSRQLNGCTILLQTWIYEYFPKFRAFPSERVGWTDKDPRALRWNTAQVQQNNSQLLQDYRRMLDLTRSMEVIWTPFGQNITDDEYVWMSAFHGCIRFFDIIEPYMPDRVLRQFGYVQSIPSNPIKPLSAYRPSTSSHYSVIYPAMESNWDDPDSHVLGIRKLGSRAKPSNSVTPDYMEWFFIRTHPQVQNPCLMPESSRYHILHEMASETRLSLIAQCLTPILPERRHQLSNDDEAWKYVDQACELIRAFAKKDRNDVVGSAFRPKG